MQFKREHVILYLKQLYLEDYIMLRELSRLKSLNAKDIALISVLSALMAATTMWAIPLPFGGITHLSLPFFATEAAI